MNMGDKLARLAHGAEPLEGCFNCQAAGNSSDRNPFVPPGESCNTIFWTCPSCGQRWMQFNTHYHLWQPITEEQEAAFRRDMASPSEDF